MLQTLPITSGVGGKASGSDVDLGNLNGIVDPTDVLHGAFKLGMSEKQMNGTKVPGS
jgi:hypothetical protein